MTLKNNTVTFLISRALLLSFILCTLQACHNDTPPPGLTYGSPERIERVGMRDVLLKVSLIDTAGQAVGAVSVFAEAPKGTDTDTTNIDGKAVIKMGLREDDSVEFHFRSVEPSEQHNIDWTTTVNDLPKEETEIRLIFKADTGGKVQLMALEY